MPGRIAILMPVFNEGGALDKALAAVAAMASQGLAIDLYLVDDGSTVPVRPAVREAPGFRVILARHRVNLGQGAALETARQMSLRELPYDAYVTMDSDGQHQATDLPRFLAEVQSGADAVFGSRFMGVESRTMPTSRRMILRMARVFEKAITGLALSDAHNGYRAFSERGIRVVSLKQNRMAHATEIKQAISRHPDLIVREIPVEVVYSAETLKKGQSSLGALNILRDLLYAYLFGGRS